MHTGLLGDLSPQDRGSHPYGQGSETADILMKYPNMGQNSTTEQFVGPRAQSLVPVPQGSGFGGGTVGGLQYSLEGKGVWRNQMMMLQEGEQDYGDDSVEPNPSQTPTANVQQKEQKELKGAKEVKEKISQFSKDLDSIDVDKIIAEASSKFSGADDKKGNADQSSGESPTQTINDTSRAFSDQPPEHEEPPRESSSDGLQNNSGSEFEDSVLQ
ncbi:MAG: hypothetical protein EZS28_005518 [Streblomastix strix]|uniref:Uncharacterized protein n=1 Tax=Streblomastix strix TaxID=222440 RepID=A0A5J4WWT0_9EUKA|nr:MAG: hypothetical protein EZS28_005518 [Streblomastix strix]